MATSEPSMNPELTPEQQQAIATALEQAMLDASLSDIKAAQLMDAAIQSASYNATAAWLKPDLDLKLQAAPYEDMPAPFKTYQLALQSPVEASSDQKPAFHTLCDEAMKDDTLIHSDRGGRLQEWFYSTGGPRTVGQMNAMFYAVNSFVLKHISSINTIALAQTITAADIAQKIDAHKLQQQIIRRREAALDRCGKKSYNKYVKQENARVVAEAADTDERLADEREARSLKDQMQNAKNQVSAEAIAALFDTIITSTKTRETAALERVQVVANKQAEVVCEDLFKQLLEPSMQDQLNEAAKSRIRERVAEEIQKQSLAVVNAEADARQYREERRKVWVPEGDDISGHSNLPDWATPSPLTEESKAKLREDWEHGNPEIDSPILVDDRILEVDPHALEDIHDPKARELVKARAKERWEKAGDLVKAGMAAAGGDSAVRAILSELSGEEEAALITTGIIEALVKERGEAFREEIKSQYSSPDGNLNEEALLDKALGQVGLLHEKEGKQQDITPEMREAATKIVNSWKQNALFSYARIEVQKRQKEQVDQAREDAAERIKVGSRAPGDSGDSTPQYDKTVEDAPCIAAVAGVGRIEKACMRQMATELVKEGLQEEGQTPETVNLAIKAKMRQLYAKKGGDIVKQVELKGGLLSLEGVLKSMLEKQKTLAADEAVDLKVKAPAPEGPVLAVTTDSLKTKWEAVCNMHNDLPDELKHERRIIVLRDSVDKSINECISPALKRDALDASLRDLRMQYQQGSLTNADYEKGIEEAVKQAYANASESPSTPNLARLVGQFILRESLKELQFCAQRFERASQKASNAIHNGSLASKDELKSASDRLEAVRTRYLGEPSEDPAKPGESKSVQGLFFKAFKEDKRLAKEQKMPDAFGEGVKKSEKTQHVQVSKGALESGTQAVESAAEAMASRLKAEELFKEAIEARVDLTMPPPKPSPQPERPLGFREALAKELEEKMRARAGIPLTPDAPARQTPR